MALMFTPEELVALAVVSVVVFLLGLVVGYFMQ